MKGWKNVMLGAAVFAATGALGAPGFVDINLGLAFPDKIGSLRFGGVATYDDPRLGYSLRYSGEAGHWFDVYVYNLGLEDIPDGPNSEIVKKEARSVSKQINMTQDRGDYSDVRKLGKTVTPMSGKHRFIKETYSFVHTSRRNDENEGKRLSESYITGYENHFVKIRYSYDAADRVVAKKNAKRMVDGLSAVMNNPVNEKTAALAAIRLFYRDPTSDGGRLLARDILIYTNETPDFTISLFSGVLDWYGAGDERVENGDLVFTAYLAGAAEHLLTGNLKKGGELQGFDAMLKVYQLLRAQDEIESVPQLEEWLELEDRAAFMKQQLGK